MLATNTYWYNDLYKEYRIDHMYQSSFKTKNEWGRQADIWMAGQTDSTNQNKTLWLKVVQGSPTAINPYSLGQHHSNITPNAVVYGCICTYIYIKYKISKKATIIRIKMNLAYWHSQVGRVHGIGQCHEEFFISPWTLAALMLWAAVVRRLWCWQYMLAVLPAGSAMMLWAAVVRRLWCWQYMLAVLPAGSAMMLTAAVVRRLWCWQYMLAVLPAGSAMMLTTAVVRRLWCWQYMLAVLPAGSAMMLAVPLERLEWTIPPRISCF